MKAIDTDAKILKELEGLNEEQIWDVYAHTTDLLRKKGLIRSRNVTGDRGEFLAIAYYNKTSGLPKLQTAPKGTQNVDAISREGERYSIKTVTEPNRTTGVFHGFGNPGDKEVPEKKFERVIIVVLDKNLLLNKLLEIDWNQFLKFRKWHTTMRAWNITVTKELFEEACTIFNKS